MYYIYLLQSLKDGSSYVGFTEDLRKRIKVHNGGGDEYTSRKKPLKLIWYCAFRNKRGATGLRKISQIGFGKSVFEKTPYLAVKITAIYAVILLEEKRDIEPKILSARLSAATESDSAEAEA